MSRIRHREERHDEAAEIHSHPSDTNQQLKCMSFYILGKKKSWTPEEDAYLIKLVQKYGAQKWTSIAENLPGNPYTFSGRIGKQCRERWHNHLNPNIKKE